MSGAVSVLVAVCTCVYCLPTPLAPTWCPGAPSLPGRGQGEYAPLLGLNCLGWTAWAGPLGSTAGGSGRGGGRRNVKIKGRRPTMLEPASSCRVYPEITSVLPVVLALVQSSWRCPIYWLSRITWISWYFLCLVHLEGWAGKSTINCPSTKVCWVCVTPGPAWLLGEMNRGVAAATTLLTAWTARYAASSLSRKGALLTCVSRISRMRSFPLLRFLPALPSVPPCGNWTCQTRDRRPSSVPRS